MKKKIVILVFLVVLLFFTSNNRVENQKTSRILFDEYHACVSPTKFSTFLEELNSKGYKTEISQEKIDSTILSRDNYDVFVIFAPDEPFSDEEKSAIKNFVEDGGGLIIFGEGGPRMRKLGETTPLNEVSNLFGIEFNEDMVEDPQRKIEGSALSEQLIISNFKSHPVTSGVESIGYLYGCSLTLNSPGIALAYGASTTISDGKKGSDVVVLVALEFGKGKILAMGDYDFLLVISEGDFLSLLDNRKLGYNMFAWVTPPPTTPPPTTPPPTTPPPTTPPPTTPPPTTPPPTTPPPEEGDGICLGTVLIVYMMVIAGAMSGKQK